MRIGFENQPGPHGGFAHDFATADGQRVISSGVDRLPERAGDTPGSFGKYFK
jgi:hypothetical protein